MLFNDYNVFLVELKYLFFIYFYLFKDCFAIFFNVEEETNLSILFFNQNIIYEFKFKYLPQFKNLGWLNELYIFKGNKLNSILLLNK